MHSYSLDPDAWNTDGDVSFVGDPQLPEQQQQQSLRAEERQTVATAAATRSRRLSPLPLASASTPRTSSSLVRQYSQPQPQPTTPQNMTAQVEALLSHLHQFHWNTTNNSSSSTQEKHQPHQPQTLRLDDPDWISATMPLSPIVAAAGMDGSPPRRRGTHDDPDAIEFHSLSPRRQPPLREEDPHPPLPNQQQQQQQYPPDTIHGSSSHCLLRLPDDEDFPAAATVHDDGDTEYETHTTTVERRSVAGRPNDTAAPEHADTTHLNTHHSAAKNSSLHNDTSRCSSSSSSGCCVRTAMADNDHRPPSTTEQQHQYAIIRQLRHQAQAERAAARDWAAQVRAAVSEWAQSVVGTSPSHTAAFSAAVSGVEPTTTNNSRNDDDDDNTATDNENKKMEEDFYYWQRVLCEFQEQVRVERDEHRSTVRSLHEIMHHQQARIMALEEKCGGHTAANPPVAQDSLAGMVVPRSSTSPASAAPVARTDPPFHRSIAVDGQPTTATIALTRNGDTDEEWPRRAVSLSPSSYTETAAATTSSQEQRQLNAESTRDYTATAENSPRSATFVDLGPRAAAVPFKCTVPNDASPQLRRHCSVQGNRQVITYNNGATKEIYHANNESNNTKNSEANSNSTLQEVIRFPNGDVQTLTRHEKAYYFASSGVLQVIAVVDKDDFVAEDDNEAKTRKNQPVRYHFPTGQVEEHFLDGTKVIWFPDGTVEDCGPDGTRHPRKNADNANNNADPEDWHSFAYTV